MDKIIVITGGFDPLHSGHISLIQESGKIGRVIIGLNSDEWLIRKKGMPFLPFEERYTILSNIKNTLCTIGFDDSDGTAIDAIKKAQSMFVKSQIVFANGGDRTSDNIPELQYCKDNNVEVMFGVGGTNKQNSSSWILSNWSALNKEQRQWGEFKTLYNDNDKIKVKELNIEPQKNISLQHHKHRSEHWYVLSGLGILESGNNFKLLSKQTVKEGNFVYVEPLMWHKLSNVGNTNLKIVEVQFGLKCDESDIERIL
jgi:cytidyltransferase-like protein